jgi:hypothetical protein
VNDKAARRPRKDGPPTGEPIAGDRSGDGDRTGTPVLTGGIPPRDAALVEVPPERTAPAKPAGDGAGGTGATGDGDGGADATRDVAGPNRVIGLAKNEAAQAGVFDEVRETTLRDTGVDIATADDDVARDAIEKGLRNEAVEQAGAGVVFDPGRVIGGDPRGLTDSELQDKLGFLGSDHEAGALLDKDPADITPEDRRGLADAIHRAELEAVLGIPADKATALERLAGEQLLRNRGAGFDVTDEQARLNELVNRNPGRGAGGDGDDGPFIGGDSAGGGAGGGSSSGDPGGNRPPGGGGGNNDIGPRPGDDGGSGRPGAGTEPPAGSPGPPLGSEAFDVRSGETTQRSDGTSTSSESTETFYRTPDGQWVDANGNPVDEGTAQALEDGTLGERNPQRDPPPSGGSGSGSGNGSGGSGDSGGSGSGGGSGSDGSGSGSGGNDTDSGTDGDDADSGDGSGSGTDPNSGGDDDDPDTELSPDPESDLVLPPGLEDVFNRFDMVGQGIANLRAQQTASGATPDSTPDPTNTVPLGAPNLGNAKLGLVGNDQRGVDSGPPILGGNTTPSFGGQAGAIDPGPDASIGSATGPELEIEIPVADGAAAHLLDDDLPPLAASDDSDDDQNDDGDVADD